MEKMWASWWVVVLNVWSLSVHANSWPMFSLPTEAFLLEKGYIETRGCPAGQGKVVDGTVMSMQPLCGTYCPRDWVLVAKSDEKCREVGKGFALQGHEIIHYPDEDNNDNGTVLYSEVSVFYGDKDASEHALQLVFTSPKEHWYCVQLDPHFPVITCANDFYNLRSLG